MTYDFLQHYWWFLIALLGALLVFLMFVQGANSMIFQLGKTDVERRMVVNSTGRKWEFTFTTLVTFGGASLLRSHCSILPASVRLIGCGLSFFFRS